MINRPSFEQLFEDSIKSDKNGVYYVNEFVKQKALDHVGFYLYTDKNEYGIHSYKFGQTEHGVVERLCGQRSASTTEKFLILDWYPSNLATIDKYDQKILRDLHNQGKCILRHVLDKEVTAREWAVFSDDNPQEIIRDHLNKIENGLNRKTLELTIWQIEAIDRLYSMLNNGQTNMKIIAELAARFGKTLTFLALFHYQNHRVMVVATYYLTALNSFKNEVVRYKEFENFEVLDLAYNDFQESYNSLINQGKKIIVIASLCGDKEKDNTVRNQNADFISKVVDKIVVVDEADYGSHTESCVHFVNKLGKNSPIILTTGTNSERAANNHKIDGLIKVTYLDMQMKALSNKVKIQNNFLKKCKRAVEFEKNLVPVQFYRFDWSPFAALLSGIDVDLNPSFTKVSADVNKHAGFWKEVYSSLLGISSNIDLNDYSLANCFDGNAESIIQFVSVKNNHQLKCLEKIAQTILHQEYDVYAVCGDDIEGKDAEQFVKDKIAIAKHNGKNVWIIADRMCQRSFSVVDINVAILCYDNGDLAPTLQKISRVLTNGNRQKTGYVISLSIDGNRNDKIAPMIMDTAQQVAEHEDVDLPTAIRMVMKSYPIFQMNNCGELVKLLPDDYAKEVFSTSNGIRLAANKEQILIGEYNDEALDLLINLDIPSNSIKQIVDMMKGKTYYDKDEENVRQLTKKEKDELQSLIHKTIINILDNIASILKYQKIIRNNITYSDLIEILNTEPDTQDLVGLDGFHLNKFIECGWIQKGIIETYVELN